MYLDKTSHQNSKDENTFFREDTMTMTCWSFLQYWLYAAFPHCHGLRNELLRHFPCSREWINQMFRMDKEKEITPIRRTIIIEEKEVTLLLYRYHVEYRMEGREVIQPCFPYHVVENLDNDTFFLLLPIVDMLEIEYSYPKLMSDLIQRLSETALPKKNIKDVAYVLSVGLAEADGAEDEPLWIIWQETVNNLYGAAWWSDEGVLHVFQQQNLENDRFPPYAYIPAPEGEDIFLWAKHMLSQWISSDFFSVYGLKK